MKKNSCALLAIGAFAPLSCACNEIDVFDNGFFRQPHAEIIYEAPKTAPEAIDAPWSPTAALYLSDQQFLYLDRATRKIVLHTPAFRQTFLDLAPYESQISSDLSYLNNWGLDFIRIDENSAVITASKRPLILVDLKNPSALVIGNLNGALPAHNLKLQDVDFSYFNGFERAENGIWLVFNHQIFFAHLPKNPSAQDFLDATLIHVAGSNDPNADINATIATQRKLSLDTYTPLKFHRQILWFWDHTRLLALQNQSIMTVTGDGYEPANGSLDSFYGNAIPTPAYIFAKNHTLYTPYWYASQFLLKIDIDDIDVAAQTVSGAILPIAPAAESVSHLSPMENDILSVDKHALALRRLSGDDPRSGSTLFGPPSGEHYSDSLQNDPQSPYRSHALVAPTAIELWLKSRAALIYSSTTNRLSFFDFNTQKVDDIFIGQIQNLTTDNDRRAWFKSGNTLYFLSVLENGDIKTEFVNSFFTQPPIMGVPCRPSDMHLTESPKLFLSQNNLLMHAPQNAHVFKYALQKQRVSILHNDFGWAYPDSTPDFIALALNTNMIQHLVSDDTFEYALLSHNDRQYLAVSNLSEKNAAFSGVTIEPNHTHIAAGRGLRHLSDHLPAADTQWSNVQNILMHDNRLLIQTSDHFYTIDDEGFLQKISSPCLDNAENLIVAAKNQTYFDAAPNVVRVCHDTHPVWKTFNADFNETAQTPLLSPCSNLDAVAFIQNNKLCLSDLHTASQRCKNLMPDFSPVAISCNAGHIYISGKLHDDDIVLHAQTTPLSKPVYAFGNAVGLPDSATASTAQLGTDMITMAINPQNDLTLFMRDSRSIWQIPAKDEIVRDTPVLRRFTDDRIGTAQAACLTADGLIYIAADDRTLYRLDDQTLTPVAKLPAHIIDMTPIQTQPDTFVLASDLGLYLYQNHTLSPLSPPSLFLNHQSLILNDNPGITPRMTQFPNENAILIPIFQNGSLLRIDLK